MLIHRYNLNQEKQAMEWILEAQQFKQMQIKYQCSIKIIYLNLKINLNIF